MFMDRKIQYFHNVTSSQFDYRFSAITTEMLANDFVIEKLIFKFILTNWSSLYWEEENPE